MGVRSCTATSALLHECQPGPSNDQFGPLNLHFASLGVTKGLAAGASIFLD